MLKGVTKTFIDGCNSKTLTYNEYIVIDNVTIPIEATLKDDCYNNGNFVGTFIFREISFETENNVDFKQKEFEYYKVINDESIKIGTFITTEVTDNDTSETVKVVGMDYGLKTQVEYISSLDYSSGLITLLDVWNECCTLSGLESGISSFANSDFIVDSDQFTGTGATIRDVFIAIAQSSCSFVKVMNDDKIYLLLNEETDDIIEDYTDLDDKRDTHPITCVRLGMSQITGENVDLKDEELAEEYGENWLIINDNPFAYTQEKKAQLITAILNKIKGFGYSSFTSKTSFKPYYTCGDVIKFKNKAGELVKSIILRYSHSGKEITLEAPSETSATVSYVYPVSAIDVAKRAEVIVNKHENTINALTQQTQNVQDNLNNNYYTKTNINNLLQTAETGITNTFSESGGNNILRNTGLWFENDGEDSETNPYEYWQGKATRKSNEKAINSNSIVIQKGSFVQEQEVPNGIYSICFKYKKLIELAKTKVKINDFEYDLASLQDKEFYTGEKDSETGDYVTQPLEVSSRHINIEFISDTNNALEVYDLMCNKGNVKLAYSQNQNETTTDTVNISKGITITSSNIDVIFRANADGIRLYTLQGEVKTRFTDKGLSTKEAIIEDEAQICGTLIQEVDDQTWWTRM